jgi:hypothetical protein
VNTNQQHRKFFLRFLNYVLAGSVRNLNLNVFGRFQLGVVKKPLRKLLALVRVARETLRFCIPLVAFAAGNFRILAHGNQKIYSAKREFIAYEAVIRSNCAAF